MCSSQDVRAPKNYRSYLLRLWRADLNGTTQVPDEWRPRPPMPVWRASLEDAHTGERTGFAGLEELLDFLREQIGITVDEPSDPHETANGPM